MEGVVKVDFYHLWFSYCIEITVTDTGIESSGRYLSCQIVEYIALYAINIGEFAVACDMTRYILKHKSDEVANVEFIWLLRSLSFAAIGKNL